ncbi:MAG: AsmA-like C-terminal domain-containing protein [Myxococcota bacterium]|nr:AsmA-like C-terminal domain-containing protein [Myxococcota bacterium]
MRQRRSRILIAAAVLLAAAVAGFAWVQPYAPERLRTELEQRLAAQLGGDVRIAELRVALGWGLRLVGYGVDVIPADGAAGLRAERLVAELRPFANLTGQRLLRLLRLEQPTLRVTRAADGTWTHVLRRPGKSEPRPDVPAVPDEVLRPLVAVEAFARRLLDRPLFADTIEVRDGTLALSDARHGDTSDIGVTGLQARMRQSWRGTTRLRVLGRFADGEGERGGFEFEGSQRKGRLHLAVALTDIDLAALAPWVSSPDAPRRLAGRVAGALTYEAPSAGHGRLEVDLVGHDLLSRVNDPGEGEPRERRVPRALLAGVLDITPDRVRIEGARFATNVHSLELDAALSRPLRPGSRAEIALAVEQASLADLRHAVGWLPEVRRDEAERLVAPLEQGRITQLRVGGAATMEAWQALLAGRSRELPRGFVVDASLASTTLRLGRDRLEDLEGRLWWTGDRFEIREATALLNGSPLPRLDLSLEGVGHLFATDPAARRRRPGARPLPGLKPLWRSLAGKKRAEPPTVSPLQLEIERLEHPILLWPLRNARATVEPVPGGVRIETSGGVLADAPLSGEVECLFEPELRVRARLRAEAPSAPPPAASPDEPGPWLLARFETGELRTGRWQHTGATGRLEAEGAHLRVVDGDIALAPAGRARGALDLDLGSPDGAAFRIDFVIEEGDIPTLNRVANLPPDLATGRLQAQGSLSGRVEPGLPTGRSLSGSVELDARDGTIARAVPAVVVVALASEVINPFARREKIRFERVKTRLVLSDGRLHTDELTLEGPDVRAVASGGIDLSVEGSPLDVELVLFLFRPVDTVLELIPVVNFILLGENENLMAAHFTLEGPWADPSAQMVPHRSFTRGPGSLVFERLPNLVRRGIEALDSIFSRGRVAEELEAPAPASPTS